MPEELSAREGQVARLLMTGISNKEIAAAFGLEVVTVKMHVGKIMRKLGAQRMTLYNLGGPAVANLVVSGEAPIVVNNRYSHMYARKKDGAKIAWRAIGPSYTAVSGVALPTRSKNPHAAMLFVDFMLSTPAQKIYTEQLGYSSLRKDMANDTAPAKKLLLALRPSYTRDYEQWSRIADQVFRSGR